MSHFRRLPSSRPILTIMDEKLTLSNQQKRLVLPISYYHYYYCLVVIFAISIIHEIAEAAPTITFITKDQIVNIGDDVELKCTLFESEGFAIEWSRVDPNLSPRRVVPIARGPTIDIPGGRFRANFDTRSSQYTLRISQINENDAGIYQCRIYKGTSTLQTAKSNVFVRIPPTISDNSTRSVITSVGADIQMQCFADGYPQPTISWRRNKNSLIPINGGLAIFRSNTLNLKNVTKENRGTYYCVADNGVSPGARRGISVEVEFKPVVRVGQVRYEQALQHDANLHCKVEAFPSPSISWIKDGLELNNNQHYSVAVHDSSNEFSHTTLTVKKIEKRQYGNYICRAANKFGASEAEVRLDETPNVVCPPACDVPNYLLSGLPKTTQPNLILNCLIFILSLFLIKR